MLYIAADNGFVELMCLVIALNPQVLQEDWLVQKDFPAKLMQHEDIIQWLVEHRKHPASLQQLCKSAILSQLGTFYVPNINPLPLPKLLKTYLQGIEPPYKTKTEAHNLKHLSPRWYAKKCIYLSEGCRHCVHAAI